MCVQMHIYVWLHICLCMHVWMEVRGQPQEISNLFFDIRSFTWAGACWLSQAGGWWIQWTCPSPPTQCWGYEGVPCPAFFNMDSGILNSRLHAYKASIFPIELSLQPFQNFLNWPMIFHISHTHTYTLCNWHVLNICISRFIHKNMCTYLIIPHLLKGARETAQLVKCFLNKYLSLIPIIHIKIKTWWHILSTSALGGSNRRILETS